MMLRYWLGYAGINPDRDVTLRVLPPSLMTQALRLGEIDGFIAGEPWSSVSVAEGIGEIAAAGVNIWQRGVERCWRPGRIGPKPMAMTSTGSSARSIAPRRGVTIRPTMRNWRRCSPDRNTSTSRQA